MLANLGCSPVSAWALYGATATSPASLNVLQRRAIKGTDLRFRVSPLVARMLGLLFF
jgi:hypothetical protein